MVSYYPQKNQGKAADIEFSEFLAGVKSGRWDAQVLPVRALYGTDGYDQAKPTLPSIAASGVFIEGYYFNNEKGERKYCTGRLIKHLQQHSGLLYLDLDRKKNPEMDLPKLRAQIEADSYTYACHLSLSGDGLAVAFRIPTEDPYGSFFALAAYYQQRFGIIVDSLPDPTRLRFVTSDPALYVNPDAATFEETAEDPKKAKAKLPARAAHPELATYSPRRDASAILLNIGVRMIERAVDGEKHNKCRDAGLTLGGYIASQFLTFDECFAALLDAVRRKENVADLKGAEEAIRWGLEKGQEQPLLPDWMHYHVRQQEREGMGREAIVLSLATCEGIPAEKLGPAVAAVLDADCPTLYTFWKKKPTAKRDGYKLEIDREKLLEWLTDQGFRAIPDAKDVRLVRVLNNIVYPIERYTIKHHTVDYAKSLPEHFDEDMHRGQVVELVLSQRRDVFDQELLHLLLQPSGEYLRDTATTKYAFFENCWTQTTAAGRVARPYAELPGLIHASQVHTHPFILLSDDAAKQCDFYGFTQRVTGDEDLRLSQVQRALGYLSHSYKDVTNARCVIFMDQVGEVGKSSGGTGKGLLMQAVAQLVEVAELKGETFDLRDAFRYEEVTDTAKVVFFDEWRPQRNPLKALYSEITGGLPINRKYQAKKTLPFKDSPKFAIATNEVVTGDDDSDLRRKVEIALAKRYSASFTPRDEFGTGFFGEYWDSAEYNRFYNLALMWVQDYLANGLLLLKDESIAARGLVQDVGVTFSEFASDLMQQARAAQSEGKDAPMWLDEVLEAYQKQTGDKRLTAIALGKKMTQWGFAKVKNTTLRYGQEKRFKTFFSLPGQEAALMLEL